MAKHCFFKMSPFSKGIYEMDDLLQCGRLAFFKSLNYYDVSLGYEFITYFFKVLQSCYFDILKKEVDNITKLRRYSDDSSRLIFDRITPESQLIVAEMINSLPNEIYEIIVDGVPDDMYRFIKNRMRKNQFRKGKLAINGKIKINKKIINSFYGKIV